MDSFGESDSVHEANNSDHGNSPLPSFRHHLMLPTISNDEGYLSMSNFQFHSMQAFNIVYDVTPDTESECYTFRRSARRSVMLRLGEGQTGAESEGVTDAYDPYWKTSDNVCTMTYMAAILGYGTFNLSSGVAKCGLFYGLLALVALSCLQWFIGLRIVELPQLLGRNVENTGGIATVLMTKSVALVYALITIVSWWSLSALHQDDIVKNAAKNLGRDKDSLPWMCLRFGLAVLLMPFVLGTGRGCSAKDLQRASVYAVILMVVIAALDSYCAIFYGGKQEERKIDWVADTAGVEDGIVHMAGAYLGVGILPHLVAEMLNPQNARKMVTKASLQIFVIYILIGTICYLGWGNLAKGDEPERIIKKDGGWMSYIIISLFIIKTALTFPIMFLPLCREVEALLEFDASPAVELRLPWALRQQQWMRVMVRIVLMVLPIFLHMFTFTSIEFVLSVPLILIHYTFPGILPLAAVLMHRRLNSRNTSSNVYMCNNFYLHLCATSFLAVFIFFFSAMIIFNWYRSVYLTPTTTTTT